MAVDRELQSEIALVKPTRARHVALGFLCSMAFVLYLDRVCISQALVPMKRVYGLGNTQASWILMSFTLAYGIFEIPTGRWGDRFGSRRVLTRIVLWWSAFTALTGCVPNIDLELLTIPVSLVFLILIRFLFGAGEAGAIPNSARILMHWFPDTERGKMQGMYQASMHIGGAIAPLVAAWLIDSRVGWRGTFVLFGCVGVVWAGAFYWWFRDDPRDHPSVNQAEAQLIGPGAHGSGHGAVPWLAAITHPNVWLLGITVTLTAFNSYFFFSWYPTYLQEARLVSNQTAGWMAALALAGATAGSLIGGVIADRITRRGGNIYRARRLLCLTVYVLASVCLYGSIHVDSAWGAAILCTTMCVLMFCMLPSWWACSFDVSGKHTGSLFGLLNGIGLVGAMGSQYFFGAFVDWRKGLGFERRDGWDPGFYALIAALLASALLWQFIYPRGVVGEPNAVPRDSDTASGDEPLKAAIQPAANAGIREGPPDPLAR
ncbi:MAG: MFS transporter [Planctomycetes bacterium]|nr:MFS transporter [Planctomycetota bacterium]